MIYLIENIIDTFGDILNLSYTIGGHSFLLWQILLLLLVLILFVSLISFIISKCCQRIVAKNSRRYKDLVELNLKYEFHDDLQSQYTIRQSLKTKAKFDRFNYDNRFNKYIEQHIEHIKDIITKVHDNIQLLERYKNELNKISPNTTKMEAKEKKVPYIIYKIYEEKVVQKNILSPVTDPVFAYQIEYTSPKGRNYYSDERRYSFLQLEQSYRNVQQQIQRRESKAYQRTLMTESLRYDILKRDGFRCVLCGRSAEDGIKLHVDHIVPVSKGGKTVPENLRTLCDLCNLGKSDKYDPNGMN